MRKQGGGERKIQENEMGILGGRKLGLTCQIIKGFDFFLTVSLKFCYPYFVPFHMVE